MRNLLPAVLIGGPPHAGKSVLLYHLTHALQERGVRHHAIRACPDGEGNWFQEGNPEIVSQIRVKGHWSDAFVERMYQDLEHRCLPFLVDMGGRPQRSQLDLLRSCTHAVLLLRADLPEDTHLWQQIVVEANLLLLAQLTSDLEGVSAITTHQPLLKGTISGLERHSSKVKGDEVFLKLVDCIATFFDSYSPQDLERTFLEQAPTELVIDLPTSLRTYTTAMWWEPQMLVPFLASLPPQTALSVYGKAPTWLYAALAAYTGQQPFYLFDPKLPFGWVQPLRVAIGAEQSSEAQIVLQHFRDVSVLSISFTDKRIEYFQPDPLTFPAIPTERGLLIDGPLPNWLLTALIRLYKEAGVHWIASFYPPLNSAVVAYSRVHTHVLGSLVSRPTT